MTLAKKEKTPIHMIILLILAGESIFILPFVLARVFRPTVLDVFQLTNLELGNCFSIYGIVAFASYIWGGTLADRFKPRILIAIALFLTALGGLYMATYPSYTMMKVLFGYWGFTTIFLFWGAMIKATRVWGGTSKQGKAFGFLEGGRGMVAASMGGLGVLIFSLLIDTDLSEVSLAERQYAFHYVILSTSLIVAIVGVLVLVFMKTNTETTDTTSSQNKHNSLANIITVLKIPSVWLLMAIILCAYVGYKLTDIFSLYANEVMLYNEIEAAKVGAFLLYMRPIVCVSIGLLADKSKASIWMVFGFLMMLIGALLFAFGWLTPQLSTFFFLSIIIVAIGTYAVRTLYFAAMQEGHIPLAITGTAVGVISLVGYTPDIFVGPAMGYLLDNSPGELGHQHVFIMLAIFSALGLLASVVFYKKNIK